MHAKYIVARVLEPCLSELHAKRAAALQRAVFGGGARRGAESFLDCARDVWSAGTSPPHQERGSATGQPRIGAIASADLWGVSAAMAQRIAEGVAGGGLVGPDPGSALALAARERRGGRSQCDAL